jgi:hypothetical protein
MLLDDALETLAERLRSIDGLTVTTDPAVTIDTPMAVVDDVEMNFNQSMRRGDALLTFEVTVYVCRSDSESGLTDARGYLSGHGDTSIRAALDTPRTDDDLLAKAVVDTGSKGESDSYITVTFAGSTHVPGAVAT